MDFELDQDQQMLARTVADFAKNESPVARFRKFRDDDVGHDPAAWKNMGELGWLGVPFPESVGGFGGGFVECATVLENLSTTLVPEPYLASVVLGGLTLLRAGNAAQHATYLTPMIEGDTTLALAYSEAQSRHDVTAIETKATPDGTGYKISGEKVWVLCGNHADHLIVSAKAPGGVTLFVVPRDAAGLTITPANAIDGRKAACIKLEDVSVDADARLGDEGSGAAVLERTMDYAAAAAVAEAVGVVDTMLQMTVDYLGTREQFGVKIGSFQALQHRAVGHVRRGRAASLDLDGRDGPRRRRRCSRSSSGRVCCQVHAGDRWHLGGAAGAATPRRHCSDRRARHRAVFQTDVHAQRALRRRGASRLPFCQRPVFRRSLDLTPDSRARLPARGPPLNPS